MDRFEAGVVDALAAVQGRPGQLRLLSDEDLYRLRLGLRRCEVLWEDALAEYGPARAIGFLLGVAAARGAVEGEESRRERARFRGVPRDAAAGWVPVELIAAIRRGVDLADLIGRWGLTDLRKLRPGVAVGRCPFHDDGSPSFYVYTADSDDQHYHCFGCQAHGDVFDLARAHGAWLSFPEAVEGLAAVAGVTFAPSAAQGRYVALARSGGSAHG